MIVAIKHAWKRLTASQTLKLLVLEFLVVLAGVLCAQLLQGWFADREERARAETTIVGIGTSLHNSAELAQVRGLMHVCLRDRIETLRDALAEPVIDQSQLAWVRPTEQTIQDNPGIDAARPLITKVYGAEQMMRFSLIEFAFDQLYAGQTDELAAWQTLSLVNPANGPVPAELRGDLQLALAEAQRSERLMYEVSGIMAANSQALGTPVHENTVWQFSQSPKLCASMAGYSQEEHREALARGELPDGSPIHPRVLAEVVAEQERVAQMRADVQQLQAAEQDQANAP